MPAIRNAQITRDRAQATNNLKRIGLAFTKFHDMNNHFPTDIRSKDGKPLLSWRVAILPFLDEGELFDEFRLDEPWDSPHNKALLAKMPSVFAIPGEDDRSRPHVLPRVLGALALFDPKQPAGVAIAEITDGTSNTILVVEAKEAVPWTKPGSELTFENDQKPEKLASDARQTGRTFKRGFQCPLLRRRRAVHPKQRLADRLPGPHHPSRGRSDFVRFVLKAIKSRQLSDRGAGRAAACAPDRRLAAGCAPHNKAHLKVPPMKNIVPINDRG